MVHLVCQVYLVFLVSIGLHGTELSGQIDEIDLTDQIDRFTRQTLSLPAKSRHTLLASIDACPTSIVE